MKVLSITHQRDAPSGVFGEAAGGEGHDVEEASFAEGRRPRRSPSDYGAVLVFGGVANIGEEEQHPWLRDAEAYVRGAVDVGTPVLGVCLGSQLVAHVLSAPVYPARRSENGWVEVELTDAADTDPLLAGFGPRLRAAEWHAYTFDLPAGAVELARTDVSVQAFRHGTRTWGLQFHAEVTRPTFERWIADHGHAVGVDQDALRRETAEFMPAWNETGREICRRFLAVAGG